MKKKANQLGEAIKKADKFDQPLNLTYYGQDCQQTIVGGFVSFLLTAGLLLFSLLKFQLIFSGEEDRLIQTNIRQNDQYFNMQEDTDPRLGFIIMASMLDQSFDNDDNPYIKFKFRQQSNFGKENSSDVDNIDIPMVKCSDEQVKLLINDFVRENWYYGQLYCPEFNESHFLYRNYYEEEYSIYQLQVHYCDPVERALQGKECATQEQIDKYMVENQMSIIQQKTIPNLDVSQYSSREERSNHKNLVHFIHDIFYGVRTSNLTV